MNARRTTLTILSLLIVFTMIFGSAVAEDGLLFRRNISKTPPLETAKAGIFMMDFYVPAQKSTGEVYPTTEDDGIEYLLDTDDGETLAYPDRLYAKPLISVYIDGPSTHTMHEEESAGFSIDGGIIFGAMDAFVGVSLDDGETTKTTNISRSADLSSFTLRNGTAYPGHVHQFVHQVFGDNIMMAWVSKLCEGGAPLYSLDLLDSEDVSYLTDLEDTYGKDAVYLYDFFGVGGSQQSVDYTEQGFPEVGEIPYSCVWTARGKLLPGDDLKTTDVVEATHVMWQKAERLTSGTRDANLPAVDCAAGAGCMLTWQEDPDGLRPGLGLGPGEGWSGAVAWQQTDIWYSHISQADFDKVFDADDTNIVGALTMAEYDLLTDATMPKPYVPMAMPVRLTDNAMCKATATATNPSAPYCYIDFDTIDDIDHTNVQVLLDLEAPVTDADFCLTTEPWTNSGGVTMELCVTDDLRLLNGKVASTRVRMNLKPYTTTDDLDGDGILDKSAWIVMAAEESKGLGDILLDGTEDPVDIGKDIWYYSFDPFKAGDDDLGVYQEFMVAQGGILNQPAQCNFDAGLDDPLCDGLTEGDFYPIQFDLRDADGDGELTDGYEFYLTEIARRFALTTNSVGDAVASESGLSAMLIYKQGIINQGGPADIMLRRTLIDDTIFDPAVDNPYAYENMECADDPLVAEDGWVFLPGTDDRTGTVEVNPNYLQGICLSPAINLTGSTIMVCDGGTDNDTCADTFPLNDDGSNNVPGDFPKVYEWRQCGYEQDGNLAAIDGCVENDLDDQTWANPFDVAKGHRGFLDKDFVMMMYAWAPNWNANAVGNDHYNLYVRRSFDGGLTWTTTPADGTYICDDPATIDTKETCSYAGTGVTALENYYEQDKVGTPIPTYYTYAAGAFEQGRNVSLLVGNKVTILDPRYSPSGGMKLYPTIRTDWMTLNEIAITDDLPYEDDALRDPSKFFMIYETGDNTTVAEGEAVPLDLFYSRATVFGDLWEWYDYLNDTEDCNPVLGVVEDWASCLEPRWPWVENDAEILSGEAGMVANPGGTFMYTVWNQWEEELYVDEFGIEHELMFNADMPFRRFLYLPDEEEVTALANPVAQILYAPTAVLATDQLALVGTGFDADDLDGQNNIVSYDWYSSIDGFIGSGQILEKVGDQLSIGRHVITLVVTDDEGATGTTTTILVVMGGAFHTSMPMMRK